MHYDHNYHKRMLTYMSGWMLFYTYVHAFSLFNCSSANVVLVALISSYKLMCPEWFNQQMVLTEPFFRFTMRLSWTYFGTLFFTNTYTVNKVLGKGELTIREIFLLLVTIGSNSVSVKRGTLNWLVSSSCPVRGQEL